MPNREQPIPANESERLRVLQNYEILNTIREDEFDRITELASLICNTPISLITLLDADRQWFKSKVGLSIDQTSRDLAFCQYTIMQDTIFEVSDAKNDIRFAENDLVVGEPNIAFYAGFPLTAPGGYNLGTICVIDNRPRNLDDKQRRALELLAKEVITLITERRQKEELRNFEKLFSLSSDLICIADVKGSIKKANPALQRLLGLKMEILQNISVYDVVHPADKEQIRESLHRISSGNSISNFVVNMHDAGGLYRQVQWMASPETGTDNLFAVGRDVTEDLEKERRLVDSETRLKSFFENSQGLMCTHDLAGNFLSVNNAGARMLGYSTEELLGKSLFDLVPTDDQTKLVSYLKQIEDTGTAKGQVTFIHRDGKPMIWMFSNKIETLSSQQSYVIANAVDITERIEIEVNLKRTTQILQETNQVARIGGWQLDLETEELMWTEVTKEIHGVAHDFQPNLQTAIEFYREGLSRDSIMQAFQNALETGKHYNLELQIVRNDGEYIWVRAIGKAEMHHGRVTRLYGTFQDINDKKKAQLELNRSRAILEAFVQHAPASVAMLDNELNYIAVSNSWLKDYNLPKSVVGKSYYAYFPDIAEEGKARHQRILQGNVEYNKEDLFKLSGNGQQRYAAWEMRPWYDIDGSIGGMMVFTRDVTDTVMQRELLEKAILQAQSASKAKSEFLANMSHEIRTPLNGVIGFTDLLLKTDLDETQQQYLTIVNQSANTLLGIINDILDFSKIEAGKLELEIERTDIYELLSQTISIISFHVESKALEMLLNIDPLLPRYIWVDSVRIKQILINLLSNAAKFTDKGEIELKVKLLTRFGDKVSIEFSLRDTGIGIHPEKQAKIFEAFSQEDTSITKKYGGTGLGLTICNKLVHMMGGNLQLESEPNIGSIFSFSISVKAQDGEPIVWENLDRVKHVLVVDDNQNNLQILVDMLELKGIHAEVANNGFQALQTIGTGKKFDAIIMDYQMPYIDGLQTISKIRELFAPSKHDLAIILLSSSTDSALLTKNIEYLQLGHRLTKPVKIEELYDALSRIYTKETGILMTKTEEKSALEGPKDYILVVEDNQINVLLISNLLKRIVPDATILTAENGLQAVESCTKKLPSLILMDVQMPLMNGIEATRHIREDIPGTSDIPIIAVTAGNTKSEIEKYLAAGMDDFLIKPINEDNLRGFINKWTKSF